MCPLCGRARAHTVSKNLHLDQAIHPRTPRIYFAFKFKLMLIASRRPESRRPPKSRALAEARSLLRYGGGGLRRFP